MGSPRANPHGGIPRTGHVSGYMLDVLRWLPFQQQIIFRLATLVWRCLLGLAPTYLQDLCCPTLSTRGRSSLRSMEWGSSLSLFLHNLPVLPQGRPVHSWWMALPYGMDFHWRSVCFPGFIPAYSTLA